MRPSFPRRLTDLLPLLLLAGCSSSGDRPATPATPVRPDIVLISLDTVRGDQGPGAWGPGVMPNFAAFASSGVRFAEAWAPGSNTLVSHGSLFTGKLPWEHRFHPGLPPPPVPPPLLPALHDAGYTVAAFTTLPIWLGHDHGFDAGTQTFRSEMVPGTTVLTWIDAWLRTNPPHPRALFVHLYDAHSDTDRLPYEAPGLPATARAFEGCVGELCASRLLKAVDDGRAALPPGAPEAIRAAYSAGVTATDQLLGQLLSMLGPTARQGFVAVFSDHGELLGEEGWLHHGSLPAVLDIPLAVHWPQGPTGKVSHTAVSLIDLYPTVLEAAGLATDGRPTLRTLIEVADRQVLAMGGARQGNIAVVRSRSGALLSLRRQASGDWKTGEAAPGLERLAADQPPIAMP